jgi:hypothetical protein
MIMLLLVGLVIIAVLSYLGMKGTGALWVYEKI